MMILAYITNLSYSIQCQTICFIILNGNCVCPKRRTRSIVYILYGNDIMLVLLITVKHMLSYLMKVIIMHLNKLLSSLYRNIFKWNSHNKYNTKGACDMLILIPTCYRAHWSTVCHFKELFIDFFLHVSWQERNPCSNHIYYDVQDGLHNINLTE